MTTLTYGDTFTLPSITNPRTGEPVTFRIDDVRDVETAGAMYEDRAAFTAIDADGNRIPTTHAVKIGRAERSIGDIARMGAEWRYGGLMISGYSVNLTEKMNDAVRADLDALTFDLPAYALTEYRAALVEAATSYGESAGYLSGHSNRAPWDGYQQDANARQLRSDAMDADTRRAMHRALVEAFTLKARESLKVGA